MYVHVVIHHPMLLPKALIKASMFTAPHGNGVNVCSLVLHWNMSVPVELNRVSWNHRQLQQDVFVFNVFPSNHITVCLSRTGSSCFLSSWHSSSVCFCLFSVYQTYIWWSEQDSWISVSAAISVTSSASEFEISVTFCETLKARCVLFFPCTASFRSLNIFHRSGKNIQNTHLSFFF